MSTDLVMGAANRKYLCIHPVHPVVPHMQMKQFENIWESTLIPLFLSPSPKGIPWELTSYSGYGSRYANYKSSLMPLFLQI